MQIIIDAPISPVIFSFFGLNLRYYGLIMCFAIFCGIALAYKYFKKISQSEADIFLDYIPFIVITAIFGARLFYVIGNLDFYLLNKKEIFLINHGGLSIWGAILFGLAGLIIYLKTKKKDLFLHLDIISSVMPLCQAIGRFGNYFNQEAFGLPTNCFIKLYVDTRYRPKEYIDSSYFHSTFLYESILDLLIFAVLLILKNRFKNLKSGTIFSLCLIFYSIARILIESIRIDSVAYVFNIPIASFICVIAIFAASCMLFKIYSK